MPSDGALERLQDIVENIDRIFEYTSGFDLEKYAADHRTMDAVERCLQRITEASIRLHRQHAHLLPDQDWIAMRDFGNVLRHDYDNIDHEIVWQVVSEFLHPLRTDCSTAIEMLAATKPDDEPG